MCKMETLLLGKFLIMDLVGGGDILVELLASKHGCEKTPQTG